MSGEPSQDEQEIELALQAFLSFREADMELWRRAGVILGLTHTSMLALASILRADTAGSPMRQVDLRRLLHVSPGGISAIVSELEDRGLVERHRSPSDRRAFLLRAGADAGPIVEKLRKADEQFRETARSLPADAVRGASRLLQTMQAVGADEFDGSSDYA